MSEFEKEAIFQLTRIADSLGEIAVHSRKLADPTEDELRERLQKSLTMALFLDSQKPDGEPLN